jgi:hypothetical protein
MGVTALLIIAKRVPAQTTGKAVNGYAVTSVAGRHMGVR